jgi:hypothetical protein
MCTRALGTILTIALAGVVATAQQNPPPADPPVPIVVDQQQPPQNPPPQNPPPGGQRPQGPPPGGQQPGPAQPQRRGQAVNIKVDVTITDQRGANPASTKQVSLTLADQEPGRIRSEGEVPVFAPGEGPPQTHNVPLNLDVRPEIVTDTKVKIFIGLEYDNVDTAEKGRRPRNMIRETASVILDSGKPLVISQSADPLTDRKVTVEVKATVLR